MVSVAGCTIILVVVLVGVWVGCVCAALNDFSIHLVFSHKKWHPARLSTARAAGTGGHTPYARNWRAAISSV